MTINRSDIVPLFADLIELRIANVIYLAYMKLLDEGRTMREAVSGTAEIAYYLRHLVFTAYDYGFVV
jgi:hypothetical protein